MYTVISNEEVMRTTVHEKVMRVNSISGRSRQFRLKRYFTDFSTQFRDAYCLNSRELSNDNSLFPNCTDNLPTVFCRASTSSS